jgi:iron complex transport system ATP-binding protein
MLRGGERIAEGATKEILTQARLEALYGAPVRVITDAGGTAFVPG